MHTLTLTFPTLNELAAAVALLHSGKAPAAGNAPQAASTSSPKPSASPAPAAAKAKDEQPKDEAPKEPFPYADLQKAVMALVKLDPEGPKAVLAHFKIPTFKGSDPAIWVEAKAMLEKAAAEVEAARAAA